VAHWLGASDSTRFVIGDLREEFHAKRRGLPFAAACVWYLLAGARLAMRVRWERRPDAAGPTAPRAPRSGNLMTDLRQAARFLRRRPTFSTTLMLTIALAVSSTSVAFAVVDGVLLEPLPYGSPERLVVLWEANPRGNQRNVTSPANFLTWREELRQVDEIAAVVESSSTLHDASGPERVGVVQASAAYFEAVGAEPLHGRFYAVDDDEDGAPGVVVLAEAYWRRRFGADPEVVGSTLRLGAEPRTVVGILPARFDLETAAAFGGIGSRDIWSPPRFGQDEREATGRYLQVIARLAEGATLESAQAEASGLAARLEELFPERQRGWGINVVPLQQDLLGDARMTILIIFGAVCLVLAIACANVVSLVLTRATERQQEMAVRAALGAGRSRLVRQLLLESALVSAAGGAMGLLAARWGIAAVIAAAPDVPGLASVDLDATVVGFALAATAGAALLFGLAPALTALRPDLVAPLRDRPGAVTRGVAGLRGWLTIAQVAVSLMLLAGAGLLTRSLANRLELGVGFDVEGLMIAEVQAAGAAYETEEARSEFFEQLVPRVRALPGVDAASAVTFPPLAGLGSRTSFWRLDRPVPEPGLFPGADVRWVHRDYHATVGVPLLAGRLFGPGDDADAPLVVLVNESGARMTWPGESPLGKRIAMPWGDTLVAEVVGVVGDVRFQGPDTAPYPMFYWEHRQFSGFDQMSLVVRGGRDGAPDVAAGIRAAVAELDPALPVYNVRAMEDLFGDALRRDRFATAALGLFAALALVLSAVGVYGVVAHAAERRAREIGIRIALGASRRSILRMVVGAGMGHVGVAILIGLVGAAALTRVLGGLVFGVSPTDPLTLTVTAAALGAVGLLACWIPARRASLADPGASVRSE
jgi:predicted permease